MATKDVKAEFLVVTQILFHSFFCIYMSELEFLIFDCYSFFKVAWLKVLFWYSPGGAEESHEKSQDNQCPIWDFSWTPPKYKSEALLPKLPRSVGTLAEIWIGLCHVQVRSFSSRTDLLGYKSNKRKYCIVAIIYHKQLTCWCWRGTVFFFFFSFVTVFFFWQQF